MVNCECLEFGLATHPPNLISSIRFIPYYHTVILVCAHEPSESMFPGTIATKLRNFPNLSSCKCDRGNLKKHKTTTETHSLTIFDLLSMIKVHREAQSISQSLWSAFGTGESPFFGCDNIVSIMSASSTVADFSVYTVKLNLETMINIDHFLGKMRTKTIWSQSSWNDNKNRLRLIFLILIL